MASIATELRGNKEDFDQFFILFPHYLFGQVMQKPYSPFSKVSECCKRLVIEHQLGAGGRQGRGGPGGQAHVHRGEDEEEDEADAGRDREVRRRGHLRDDQPASADVEQDQAEPN